jgi:hypothetical protein
VAKIADIKMEIDAKEIARIYTLVAQMNRLMIRVEGMKAFNAQRDICGSSLVYNEEAFKAQEDCVGLIVDELIRIQEGKT